VAVEVELELVVLSLVEAEVLAVIAQTFLVRQVVAVLPPNLLFLFY
jgi:hypothetical protein